MSDRRVVDTDASTTPGLTTWPETEESRVPPCVLVPRPANHSAPRLMMWGTAAIVSTLLTMVGWPKAPLTAGNGGLILGHPFLPSRDDRSPVSSPQIYAPAPRWITMSKSKPDPWMFLPRSRAAYASTRAPLKMRHGCTYSPRM